MSMLIIQVQYKKHNENLPGMGGVFNIYSQLSDNNGIGMEKIIDRLVGRELTSNSHENVSALYKFAKFRMTELIKNGDVKFTTAWDGSLTSYSWNAKAIKELREEIMFIKKLID